LVLVEGVDRVVVSEDDGESEGSEREVIVGTVDGQVVAEAEMMARIVDR
jgi:hypothetical protein